MKSNCAASFRFGQYDGSGESIDVTVATRSYRSPLPATAGPSDGNVSSLGAAAACCRTEPDGSSVHRPRFVHAFAVIGGVGPHGGPMTAPAGCSRRPRMVMLPFANVPSYMIMPVGHPPLDTHISLHVLV